MQFRTLNRIKALRLVALVAGALSIAACSVNLQQGDLEGIPLTHEKYSFFGNIPLVYGGDTLQLEEKLLRAYTEAAPQELYPRKSCRGDASIHANVTENSSRSSWALGAVIIPFWPILPVDETLSFTLDARIFCNGTLVKHVEFSEQERIQAKVYGILRSDLINDASRSMHKKLVQRLHFELSGDRQTDMNSILSMNTTPNF